jgi:hypothetical protein
MPLLWNFDVRIDDFFARSRIRFSRMPQYLLAPLAALALLMAFEGTSAAKTQAELVPGAAEMQSSPAPAEAAKASTTTFAADRDLANSVFAARIRICHISRHPRDGVPAEEHACPLFIADAAPAIAGAVRID